jgi:hypothetical protein
MRLILAVTSGSAPTTLLLVVSGVTTSLSALLGGVVRFLMSSMTKKDEAIGLLTSKVLDVTEKGTAALVGQSETNRQATAALQAVDRRMDSLVQGLSRRGGSRSDP